MLFVLEILQILPAFIFNGSDVNIYTPFGIVPATLRAGEVIKVHVPDFHTILTFQLRQRKVSYRLIDLLDSMSVNFAPFPLIVRFNVYRKIQKSDVRGKVIGHRGSGRDEYRKENNLPFIPENTVVSFKQAFTSGADWVEFDVQMTSDNEIVIHHDYNVTNTLIWNMTLAEFERQAPFQTTLSQVLSELDRRVKLLMELKYPSAEESVELGSAPNLKMFAETVLKILHKKLNGRALRITSFEPEILLLLRQADETLDLYFLTEGLPGKYADHRRNSFGEGIQFCSESDLQGIVTDTDTINSDPVELIAAAHEAGLQVMVYWWRSLLSGNNIMVSEIVNLDCADVDGMIVDNIRMAKTILKNVTTCVWTRDSSTASPSLRKYHA